MGMAASQARYIELTARKNNVEYEGQQINQERTNLANESSGLFNQMLALTVPTAPSTTDYTTTQYSFNNGDYDCTVTNVDNLTGDADYNKEVTYYYTQKVDKGIGATRSDLGVTQDSGTYWLTNGSTSAKSSKLAQCTTDKTSDNYDAEDVDNLTQVCIDNPTSNIATAVGYQSGTQSITESMIGNAYKYTNADGNTYYYSNTDLTAAINSGHGYSATLTGYYDSEISEKVYNTSDAYVETADSGRYSAITLDGYTTSFDMTAKTTTNDNAYADAMNEYNYQSEVYEQSINNINARTEIVQQEDRTLEMKLKQLDTEQEALNTEMESVKKVIDKNIEQTFKTFQ